MLVEINLNLGEDGRDTGPFNIYSSTEENTGYRVEQLDVPSYQISSSGNSQSGSMVIDVRDDSKWLKFQSTGVCNTIEYKEISGITTQPIRRNIIKSCDDLGKIYSLDIESYYEGNVSDEIGTSELGVGTAIELDDGLYTVIGYENINIQNYTSIIGVVLDFEGCMYPPRNIIEECVTGELAYLNSNTRYFNGNDLIVDDNGIPEELPNNISIGGRDNKEYKVIAYDGSWRTNNLPSIKGVIHNLHFGCNVILRNKLQRCSDEKIKFLSTSSTYRTGGVVGGDELDSNRSVTVNGYNGDLYKKIGWTGYYFYNDLVQGVVQEFKGCILPPQRNILQKCGSTDIKYLELDSTYSNSQIFNNEQLPISRTIFVGNGINNVSNRYIVKGYSNDYNQGDGVTGEIQPFSTCTLPPRRNIIKRCDGKGPNLYMKTDSYDLYNVSIGNSLLSNGETVEYNGIAYKVINRSIYYNGVTGVTARVIDRQDCQLIPKLNTAYLCSVNGEPITDGRLYYIKQDSTFDQGYTDNDGYVDTSGELGEQGLLEGHELRAGYILQIEAIKLVTTGEMKEPPPFNSNVSNSPIQTVYIKDRGGCPVPYVNKYYPTTRGSFKKNNSCTWTLNKNRPMYVPSTNTGHMLGPDDFIYADAEFTTLYTDEYNLNGLDPNEYKGIAKVKSGSGSNEVLGNRFRVNYNNKSKVILTNTCELGVGGGTDDISYA